MAQPLSEFFNGGVVTVRHPALLRAGELQLGNDCFYRDKDPAIWRHPGRTAMNSTPLAAGVKGLMHLTWEGTRTDQLIAYSGTRLWRAPISSITPPVTFAEMSGPGAITGVISGTTLFTADSTSVASCTISGVNVTTSNSFAGLVAGAVVSGTGVTAGTKILSITSDLALILDTAATSGTVTLTFSVNPFTTEVVGSPIVFTASSNAPATGAIVTATSGSVDAAGHYPAVILSVAQTNGAYTIAFQHGIPLRLANNGADVNHNAVDETLDGAFYGSSYFVWTGRGAPRRVEWRKRTNVTSSTGLDDVLVARPTGLLPVQQPFTTSILSGLDANGDPYSWPTAAGTGVYWFLLTEMMEYDVPGLKVPAEVEGAYLGDVGGASTDLAGVPVTATISALTQGVQITTPASGARNNGGDACEGRLATHWCVYMYGPTDDASVRPSLASFRRAIKVPIQQTTTGYGVSQTLKVADSRFTQGWVFPSVAVGGTTDGKQPFTNESFMLGPPGPSGTGLLGSFPTVARAKSGTNTDGAEQQDAASTLKTFKLASAASMTLAAPWASRPISGITLGIVGSANPSGNAGREAGYYFYLVNHAGTKRTPVKSGSFNSQALSTNYVGGETDNLGVNWVTADFDTDFKIIIAKSGTGSRQRLAIDAITLFIHWSSGTINLNGKPYRVVTYRDQIGTTVNDPANIPMRECSTGDFFQGSLVTDDLGDETAIRFTLPNNPESQPNPYVMRFNSKKKDKVKVVKRMGTVLVVGMQESIKRVNYLPRETDTDLQSGLAHEDIALDHGMAGPQSCVAFDFPGKGTMLAYASLVGPGLTDGITTQPLNPDLDWPATVKLSALGSSVFRCYPKEKMLALYYCPAGATHNLNTRVMYFCYQADKIKPGGYLPMIGPAVVSGKCAVDLSIAGVSYLFTGHEADGTVYREDSGTTIPTGYRVRTTADDAQGDGSLTGSVDVKIIPRIRTRKFFPGGLERDARESRIYLLYSPYGSSGVSGTATTLSNGNLSVASAAAWGSVIAGMSVYGTGVPPGTYVTSRASSSLFTVNQPLEASAAGAALTFDTGTLVASVRGSGIQTTMAGMSRHVETTVAGDLLVFHNDNMWQGLEIDFEKVPVTFVPDADNVRFAASDWADLGTEMRLHQFTWLISDGGLEQNRAS